MKMPLPYTPYDPNKALSQNQIDILKEIKKIMEARILHNTNLLEFLQNKENKTQIDALIKNLFFTCGNSKAALNRMQKDFTLSAKDDIKSYIKFLEQIKSCKTVHEFDGLFFQFFLHFESLQHQDNIGDNFSDQYLLEKKISAEKKKELNHNAKKAAEETDVYESIYYKEFCDMLAPHISKRSHQFKVHHTFKYTTNATSIESSLLGLWLIKLFNDSDKALATKVQGAVKTGEWENLTVDGLSQYNIINQKFRLLDSNRINKKSTCFELYKIARQRFDFLVDLVLQADVLLHPPTAMTQTYNFFEDLASKAMALDTDSEQETFRENIKDTSIAPLPTALNVSLDLNTEVVTDQTTLHKMSVESPSAVVVHVTENRNSKLQERLSTCTSAVKPIEQKNDALIEIPFIEFSKINPALQFLAALNLTESEILLNWTKKAPHMQVALTELVRMITKLNGEIDTSGGGSHHKIIFKNSIVFVHAFEQSPTTGTKKENIVKGTLVKQHGKEKSSRFLPAYAIKTFMQTLQRMGATETILRIYKNSCAAFPNSQDKMLLLTRAQMALEKDKTKMLLLLGVYKGKKGGCADLRKLDFTSPGRKPTEHTQHLVRRLFSFI